MTRLQGPQLGPLFMRVLQFVVLITSNVIDLVS